jgi:Icc-related predicted phosphoesterase
VKLLAFSDLHRDLGQAAELVAMSAEADVVIGAGDFASVHEGLVETIDALASIDTPTVLVPGNNETEEALREAAAGWSAATVLHGSGTTIVGADFYGLGAGVPVTPWEWSFDLDDEEATSMLAPCSARSKRRVRGWRSAATSTSRGDARAGSARRRSATSARRAPGSRSRRRGT